MAAILEYVPVVSSSLVMLALVASYLHVRGRHREKRKVADLKSRVESYATPQEIRDTTRGGGLGHLFMRVSMAVSAGVGSLVPGSGGSQSGKMQLELSRAGFQHRNALQIYQGARLLFAIALAVPVLAWTMLPGVVLNPQFQVLLPTTALIIGFLMPMAVVTYKTRARQKCILREFPDALDLMVVCVEAGMGLNQAINRVAREMAKTGSELSLELDLVNRELMAGRSRHDALRSLSRRVDLPEVDALVTLLIQADTFGTSIARTLRVYSDTLRTSRFQRAQQVAAKLPVKMLFPLVLFIFPALFVVLLGPAFLRIMETLFAS
jgi:tight adherence protein C